MSHLDIAQRGDPPLGQGGLGVRGNERGSSASVHSVGQLTERFRTPSVQETPAAVDPRPEAVGSHPPQAGSDGGEAPVEASRPGRLR